MIDRDASWPVYEITYESGETVRCRCASEAEAWRAAWDEADGEDVASVERVEG